MHSASGEILVFARLHARSGKQAEVRQAMFEVSGPTRKEPGCPRWKDMVAFERHAELPHTVRFVETVEPLLDHPFKATLSEQLR